MTQPSNSPSLKKEVPPGVFIGIIVTAVLAVIIWFVMSGSGSSAKVDLKKLDPRDLRDEDPIKRGQPGYRERIDEAPK